MYFPVDINPLEIYMETAYELNKMEPISFEHMVNALATGVLGSGHTGFGPGADGGRDGYFEGEAPYPSTTDRWSGVWYIQSKFHKRDQTSNQHTWLLSQIAEEIKQFQKHGSRRKWPDVWIIATNIDASGVPETGAFDRARALVSAARPALANRFHIWGGNKLINLLDQNPQVAARYGQFITPGHVLASLADSLSDSKADIETIIRYFVVDQLVNQRHAKLDQAGSEADNRPGLHNLFVDLPFSAPFTANRCNVVDYLTRTAARSHRPEQEFVKTVNWRLWNMQPNRARVWFIKGGPGQGKSTATQFFCQVHRAALLQEDRGRLISTKARETAEEIEVVAKKHGCWPTVPRIPVYIELRDYTQWVARKNSDESTAILAYLASRISKSTAATVETGTLKRALRLKSWIMVFDGLDEVPDDSKSRVSAEIINFVDNLLVETNCDAVVLCTSRPQGYSGQYDEMEMAAVTLDLLSPEEAFLCARPVIELDRTPEQAKDAIDNLRAAIDDGSIVDLMTTPLQAHIMAVVVRDGGRPPDRRWKLFNNFFEVIRRREANHNLPDSKLARLLREDDKLIRRLHANLGFILHARAEKSSGAQTQLPQTSFQRVIVETVREMRGESSDETVQVLEQATRQRLVLINTPDDGSYVRFDIRPLQEYFAAEFIYGLVDTEELRTRLQVIAGDQHWREVMHFVLSALVEQERSTELSIAIEVLEQLDDGAYDYTRELSRRMCRGASLTMRITREGVLEQDIRVWSRFKKLVKSLSSNPTIDAYELCGNSFRPSARVWIINIFLEALKEMNPTELLGVAIILTHLVADSDEIVGLVSNLLLAMPKWVLAYVISARAQAIRKLVSDENARWDGDAEDSMPLSEAEGTVPQNWLTCLCLRLLRDENWDQLGVAGLGAVRFVVFSAGPSKAATLAREIGYTTDEIELLSAY